MGWVIEDKFMARASITRKIQVISAIPPAAAPLRTGGTVHALLSDWSGTGFHLLTTAPGAPVYRGMPHGGSVWDNDRRIMWLFGADTHGLEIDMDNAVYGWRASDGQIIKQYDADPISGYRMDAEGILWSSSAKNRPWASHTFRRMRFIPEAHEIEVIMDPLDHAGMEPPLFEEPGQDSSDRVSPIWYYNVVTGQWRYEFVGASTSFVGLYTAFPVGWHPVHGWFVDNGATWTWLSPAGARTDSGAIWNKVNTQYHSFMHVVGDVAYKTGGNNTTWLYSRHPLGDLAASERFAPSGYAALSGLSTANNPSVLMPDGRIIFFALFGTAYRAFILDPVANTVTYSGHELTGVNGNTGYYEFAAEWSTADNCAILLSRRFSPNRVYAYRPE